VPRDPDGPERRQSYCPDCGERGKPSTVTFLAKLRIITYKCDNCGSEWIIQTEAGSAFTNNEPT
jgi:predicted RNA-binding Zn-ribbon protein involved in translation (DUF1610 family)